MAHLGQCRFGVSPRLLHVDQARILATSSLFPFSFGNYGLAEVCSIIKHVLPLFLPSFPGANCSHIDGHLIIRLKGIVSPDNAGNLQLGPHLLDAQTLKLGFLTESFFDTGQGAKNKIMNSNCAIKLCMMIGLLRAFVFFNLFCMSPFVIVG